MANSKKIVITTVSREIFIIRGRRSGECGCQSFCETCAAETEMLTLEQVANFALTDTREMVRRIDEGRIHSVQNGDGEMLVCTGPIKESRETGGEEKTTIRPTLALKASDLTTRET